MSTKLLDLVNITKSYDGVTILDDLNLYIREKRISYSPWPERLRKNNDFTYSRRF